MYLIPLTFFLTDIVILKLHQNMVELVPNLVPPVDTVFLFAIYIVGTLSTTSSSVSLRNLH